MYKEVVIKAEGFRFAVGIDSERPNVCAITMFSPDDDYISMVASTASVLESATEILKEIRK